MRLTTLAAVSCAGMITSLCAAQRGDFDVLALINDVREKELWVEDVDSFYLRLNGMGFLTPAARAEQLDDLKRMYPERDEFDQSEFRSLRPRSSSTVEIAFDEKRMRYRHHLLGRSFSLYVWDGQEARGEYGDAPYDVRTNQLDDTPELAARYMFMNLAWLRGSGPTFWWEAEKWERKAESLWGRDIDFRIVGREDYRGVECHVLENMGGARWYVSVEGHFLHGAKLHVLTNRNRGPHVAKQVAARRGVTVHNLKEYHEWLQTLSLDDRLMVVDEYMSALRADYRPNVEFFMTDYREIEPGMWFPLTQGTVHFQDEPDADGEFAVSSVGELRVDDIQINQPLADELFAIEFKPGRSVTDRRFDVRVRYSYDPEMPQEKLDELLAQSRSLQADREASKNADDEMIGRPAPAFLESQWLNSEALSWDDLRGKVVVLEFWAEWCGPCRGQLPLLAELHKKREENGFIVIGMHPPGSRIEDIQHVMDLYDIECPIYIDQPQDADHPSWGALFKQYHVSGIPHTIVVDSQGVIRDHALLLEWMKNSAFGLVNEMSDG